MDTQALEGVLPVPAQRARKRGSRGMSREQLEQRFPSLSALSAPSNKATQQAWVAVFNIRPDAMHRLLADYIKQVHAQPGRIGQRPMPEESEVDFEGLLYGPENDSSLVDVMPGLMAELRLGARTLSERCATLSRAQIQRILLGEYDPTAEELRQLAAALRKPPVFFVEYRQIMAVAAFLNLINERPGIATELYRSYIEIRMP